MHRPAFRRIEGPPHDPNAPTDEPTDPAPRERWAPTRSRHPIAYAGDKGFDPLPPARLARLTLTYAALAADRSVPGALRDYSQQTLAELRPMLTRKAAS